MTSQSSDEASSISDDGIQIQCYSATEIMKHGLVLVHYTRRRLKRAKPKVNIERFKGSVEGRSVGQPCMGSLRMERILK